MKIIWWINPESLGEEHRKRYESMLELLKELKVKRQIDFQVISDFEESKVYREVFWKNNKRLYKNTARSIRELRAGTRKKNYHIKGTIAFFDGTAPIYYFKLCLFDENCEKFLKNILDEGEEYLYKLIETNRKLVAQKDEEKVEMEFQSRVKEFGFHGKLTHDYKLHVPELEGSDIFSAKEIDFLHEDNGKFDVIEVKAGKPSWEAVGQVIGYKELLCKQRGIPKDKVDCVIVCKQRDELIEFVCKRMNIKVIIMR